ncbi:MAG: NUDIX domain-containing protein [Clostridia bacterium]|nr:NUDIX domain-containing protein [Clostridia bacterium]
MERIFLFDSLPKENWTYPVIQKALVNRFLYEHKIFGIKENVKYMDREGAYIIPFNNEKIGVVKTPRGYFLLGGGIDGNEEHEECIKRECLEETGYSVQVCEKICTAETFTYHSSLGYFHPIQHYYFGTIIKKIQEPVESDHVFVWLDIDKAKGNMHPQMQNWAIEQAILLRKKQ